PGGAAARPRVPAQRGGPARRAAPAPPGGAQPHGAARPRGAVAAALRATDPCRGGAGPRHHRGDGGQALPPGAGPPQGPAQPTARRARGIPAMNTHPLSEADPLDPVAEEFLGRLRQGERPPLSEYVSRYPDLAERIREVFPALALLEQG